MPKLTIKFHDMFLYVRRSRNLDVVLLPRGSGDSDHEHKATITGSGVNRDLANTELSFCHKIGNKFVQIPGNPHRERPAEDRLVHLDDILGKDGVVRPDLLTEKVEDFPKLLNARIILPNGKGKAEKARRPDADDVDWTFAAKGHLKAIQSQELTDTLHVEVDVEPNPDLYAVFNNQDAVLMVPNEGKNYVVTIHNMDVGCKGEVKPGNYTLYEYQFLYELTKASSESYRFPTGNYRNGTLVVERSKCLPICGGADCPEG